VSVGKVICVGEFYKVKKGDIVGVKGFLSNVLLKKNEYMVVCERGQVF